jgi:hypothetical protein
MSKIEQALNKKPLKPQKTMLAIAVILPVATLIIVPIQLVLAQLQPQRPGAPAPAAPPPAPEYNPPPAPAPDYNPPPAPSIVRNKLGCDNKGQINTVRQIQLGEKVYCVLGIGKLIVI